MSASLIRPQHSVGPWALELSAFEAYTDLWSGVTGQSVRLLGWSTRGHNTLGCPHAIKVFLSLSTLWCHSRNFAYQAFHFLSCSHRKSLVTSQRPSGSIDYLANRTQCRQPALLLMSRQALLATSCSSPYLRLPSLQCLSQFVPYSVIVHWPGSQSPGRWVLW